MSHIYKSNQDLLFIEDIYKETKKYGYKEDIIEEVLRYFIPKDKNKGLINYKISKDGIVPASYSYIYNNIFINISSLYNWLEYNYKDMDQNFLIKDMELLIYSLFVFIISHEIEHGIQGLISKDSFDNPCNYVKDGYKNLFELIDNQNVIISPKKFISKKIYYRNEESLVVERNANVEAYDLVCKFLKYINNEDLFKIFDYNRTLELMLGYNGNNNGSFLETYRTLHMMKQYNELDKNYDLDEDVKLRYGLPISMDAKQKLLKKII